MVSTCSKLLIDKFSLGVKHDSFKENKDVHVKVLKHLKGGPSGRVGKVAEFQRS